MLHVKLLSYWTMVETCDTIKLLDYGVELS